jgi:hypothetical protein
MNLFFKTQISLNMKYLIYYLVIFIFCSSFTTCNNCVGGKCSDQFSFRLIDKTTKQDLVFSPAALYQSDSVYLTTRLQGYEGAMSSSEGNHFTSRLLIPVDTFFLRISSTDIDTVIMSYNYKNSNCCEPKGYGVPANLKFNGNVAVKDGEVYLFEK